MVYIRLWILRFRARTRRFEFKDVHITRPRFSTGFGNPGPRQATCEHFWPVAHAVAGARCVHGYTTCKFYSLCVHGTTGILMGILLHMSQLYCLCYTILDEGIYNQQDQVTYVMTYVPAYVPAYVTWNDVRSYRAIYHISAGTAI